MKTTTTATLELRDDLNNLVKVLKRKISLKGAYDYLNRHNGVIWVKNVPCTVVINWN